MNLRLRIDRIPEQRRRLELAGDGRAGAYPRQRAREAQREYFQRNWRWMAVWGAAVVLLPLLALALPEPPVVTGYLAGAVSTGMIATLWFWVVQETGTAPRMRGDIAERHTAAELRRLRKRGWRLVNHFLREKRDIDHVMLGPGGALVISTKWSATPWDVDAPEPRVLGAAEEVAGDAKVIQSLLARHHVDVTPVLMLWGPASDLPARLHRRTGTVVICGRSALRVWLASLPQRLDTSAMESAWAHLADQVANRDARAEPLAPTFESMVAGLFAAVGAAIAAFLLVAETAAVTSILPLVLVAPAAAVGIGQVAIRRSRMRMLGVGWLVGSVAAAAVVAAAVAVSLIQ